MATNPVCWFEIYVNNLQRAKTFYQAVLDVELTLLSDPTENQDIEMLAFPSNMEEYGATGALVKMVGVSAGGNSSLVYFSCQDCAIEGARIEGAGGKIEQDKMPIGEHGFIVVAMDSEGNMFGLHSLK